MPEIRLSRGYVAVVDQDDYDRLAQYKWFYKPERTGQGSAMRHVKNAEGKTTTEYLSRAIAKPPVGMQVIYFNHDRLDCRKENLRVVDAAHAQRHRGARKDNNTGHKGVKYNAAYGTYTATLWRDGKVTRVGTYNRLEDAVAAYDEAARTYEEAELARMSASGTADSNLPGSPPCSVPSTTPPTEPAKARDPWPAFYTQEPCDLGKA